MAVDINSRTRVDWPAVLAQNKGLFMVEKDYQFPGGFYVRHKNTPYLLTGSRRDIELMIENALAALGTNTGPIILATDVEAERIATMTQSVMELLDTKLPRTNRWYLNLLWGMLNTVKVHPRALPVYL